ncbi:MAG TPA: hypothetical protein VIL74_08085 [Pyrinomonadaceae bacterium]|jgi:hypothetical protein
MSKGVKTILIVVGILAALAILCGGGFALFAYFFVDKEGMDNARTEGAEFGRMTDNVGCQAKSLEKAKSIDWTDIDATVKVQYFNEGCLFASRPTENFCDGMPSEQRDIWNKDRAKDAECEKFGMKESLPCRAVMRARLEYCQKKR